MRILVIAGLFFTAFLHRSQSIAQPTDQGGGPMPALNFCGRNICLSLPKYSWGRDLSGTVIQSKVTLGAPDTIHEISQKQAGSVRIVERVATDADCTALPLDVFTVVREGDKASARFCLTGVKDGQKVFVDISYTSAQASKDESNWRQLHAVAAYGTRVYSDIYVDGDAAVGRTILARPAP